MSFRTSKQNMGESSPTVRLASYVKIEKGTLFMLVKLKKTFCTIDPMPISDLVSTENFHLSLDIMLRRSNVNFYQWKELPLLCPSSKVTWIIRLES